jgi:hypothetical protein
MQPSLVFCFTFSTLRGGRKDAARRIAPVGAIARERLLDIDRPRPPAVVVGVGVVSSGPAHQRIQIYGPLSSTFVPYTCTVTLGKTYSLPVSSGGGFLKACVAVRFTVQLLKKSDRRVNHIPLNVSKKNQLMWEKKKRGAPRKLSRDCW